MLSANGRPRFRSASLRFRVPSTAGGDRDGLHGGRVADRHAGDLGGLQGDVHRLRLQGDPARPGLHARAVRAAQGHQERQCAGEW